MQIGKKKHCVSVYIMRIKLGKDTRTHGRLLGARLYVNSQVYVGQKADTYLQWYTVHDISVL